MLALASKICVCGSTEAIATGNVQFPFVCAPCYERMDLETCNWCDTTFKNEDVLYLEDEDLTFSQERSDLAICLCCYKKETA